jgi:uncharacterized membrane protein YhaH (DUF805 family)
MLSQIFSFNGRMARSAWWLTRLGSYGAYLAALAVTAFVAEFFPPDLDEWANILVVALGFVVLVWVEIATSIRRLHDIGLSGWFCLFALIPFLGLVFWLVVLGLTPGAPGLNRYGLPPNARAAAAAAADIFV